MLSQKSRLCQRKRTRIHQEQRSIEEMNKLDKEITMNVYEDKINNIVGTNSYSMGQFLSQEPSMKNAQTGHEYVINETLKAQDTVKNPINYDLDLLASGPGPMGLGAATGLATGPSTKQSSMKLPTNPYSEAGLMKRTKTQNLHTRAQLKGLLVKPAATQV